MVADYRYVFCSMRTEQVLQEIDLYGVYLSMAMNGSSSQFDGTFQLDQTGKRNEDLIACTQPGRTFVVVERNNVPIGAWIVWSRVYSAQSKTIQMHGIPFDFYPKKARVESNTIFTDVEQVEIFKQLWRQMQGVYGRNINVNVSPTVAPTLVRKSIEVHPYEVKYYSEVMSSLCDASDGFDWYITITKEGNYYRKDLRIGYPILGSPVFPGMTVFEYPGNVTQYYMTESMADAGTNVLTTGAGEGSDMLAYEVIWWSDIAQGMPRWDIDLPRKDIDNTSLLVTVGNALGEVHRPPMTSIKLTVKGDAVPEFGSYNLGDMTRVVFKDARNPTGFQADKRLISWSLHPPTGDQVEEADLVFEGDDEEANAG